MRFDAMGCQREIAQQIIAGGADYVLAVKENQGRLHEGIRDLFQGAEALGFDGVPYDYARTVDKGHGRVIAYADLKAAVRVVGHRQTGGLRLPCPAELRENKILADLNIAWRRRWGVRAVSQPFPGKFDQSTGSRSRDRIEFRKTFFIKVGPLRNDAPF